MNNKLSVQDVDRCVNEKQNSDSGSVGKPPSPQLEGKLAAAETADGQAGLLPCPFCGNEAQPRRTSVSSLGEEFDARWVECGICEIGTKYHDSVKTAARTWNARVHQPPEQNSEDKNSGEMQTKASSLSTVVIPESVSLDADRHLLVCLAEECAEVIQAVSKALRFGLDDDHQSANPAIVSPRLYIARELADVDAVYGLLEERGVLPPLDDRHIKAKCNKLLGFMEYAQQQGTLASNPITQDTASPKASNSTTVPDPSPASLPDSKSPSESESTLVTVDGVARRAAEKIVNTLAPHELQYEQYYRRHKMSKDIVLNQVAEIIATELNVVHQPDVQTTATMPCPHWDEPPSGTAIELLDKLGRSLSSLTSGKPSRQVKEVWGYFWQLDARLRIPSPVQPEVSKEQDNE